MKTLGQVNTLNTKLRGYFTNQHHAYASLNASLEVWPLWCSHTKTNAPVCELTSNSGWLSWDVRHSLYVLWFIYFAEQLVHMTAIVFGRVCSLKCPEPNTAEGYRLLSQDVWLYTGCPGWESSWSSPDYVTRMTLVTAGTKGQGT